jgi:hypothetical protein
VHVLFTGEIGVHYGFIWLLPEDDIGPEDFGWGGQNNGLAGAAFPGRLSLMTGTHTGVVPLAVELHDAEPVLSDEWEDVVEVSFTSQETALTLAAFEEFEPVQLPEPGTFRVRYCASGMDEAHRMDTDGPVPDRYLLQLWPASPAPDAVIRQTSEQAAYWHRTAQETPPPDPSAAFAADEIDEQEQRESAVDALETLTSLTHLWMWRGSEPTPDMTAVGGRVHQLAQIDREFTQEIVSLTPDVQRDVAGFVATWACHAAGIDVIPEVAAGLKAIADGRPLPPPLDNRRTAIEFLFPPTPGKVTFSATLHSYATPPERVTISPRAAAHDSMYGAASERPDQAAVEALVGATAGLDDPSDLIADVRSFIRRRTTST